MFNIVKAKKDQILGIRIDEELLKALEKLADKDDRSVSAMARKLIVDGLRQHGALKKGD